MSEFQQKIISLIRMIPHGNVASYGQIALYAGMPRAAREVGWTLRGMKEEMPWWRVVNNAGRISIDGNMDADKELQRKLLESEGIQVADDYTLSIDKYRWILSSEEVRKLNLPDEVIKKIMQKYYQRSLL